MNTFAKDFWVSYNKADRPWAEWIAWKLEEAGYTTVLQAWDFRPGANFVLEMDSAARAAARTISVLSTDYLAAAFPQSEWAAAFAHDPAGKNRRLVPVRVHNCNVEGILRQVIYIDLVDLNEDAATQALLDGVISGRAKPPAPPSFPGADTAQASLPARFPGTLPSIWNVPHLRDRNFAGREDELRGLWESFSSGEPTRAIQAIHGRGGMGKTYLALEYAYRYAAKYNVVWWVRSDAPATLAGDMAALAEALELPEGGNPNLDFSVAAVRRWLSQSGRWLLVFDSAEDLTSLRPYLPQLNPGHLLITSQNSAWLGLAIPLAIPVLPTEDAVAFLQRRTGQEDVAAASALADELGGLPLALEQAGAYIEETTCGLLGYLELFRQRWRELVGLGPMSTGYPHTVATTWDLSFRRVGDQSPATADLLDLVAFLAPSKIRFTDLREGASALPDRLASGLADDISFNKLISVLQRYSLLDPDGDGFASHRLVQAVTRARLTKEGETEWAVSAGHLMYTRFPHEVLNPLTWATCERLMPHALVAAQHVVRVGVFSPQISSLLSEIGAYLIARGQYDQARIVAEQALAFTEANVASDDPELAICLNNLGTILAGLKEVESARACLERALPILDMSGPTYLDEKGKCLSNLGSVLNDQGDFEGAWYRFHEAREVHESLFGETHPTTAVDLNNLGALLRDKQKWSQAFPYLDTAAQILRATVGIRDPRYPMAASSLGVVLLNLGRIEEAREYLEEAVQIGGEIHNDHHPDLVWFLLLLARFREATGDSDGARGTGDRALGIARKVLDDEHPLTRELMELRKRIRLKETKRYLIRSGR